MTGMPAPQGAVWHAQRAAEQGGAVADTTLLQALEALDPMTVPGFIFFFHAQAGVVCVSLGLAVGLAAAAWPDADPPSSRAVREPPPSF